jgi:hypothetical protein
MLQNSSGFKIRITTSTKKLSPTNSGIGYIWYETDTDTVKTISKDASGENIEIDLEEIIDDNDLGMSGGALFGEPVLYDSSKSVFGDGSDGAITIVSGTVNIDDIYNNETVEGIITVRGENKGLNYGWEKYDPENGYLIQATTFIINEGATLTHSKSYATGTNNKYGIMFISCKNSFTNNGIINMNGKGYQGGTQVVGNGEYREIKGGYGGGAIRILSPILDTSNGNIYCNGTAGSNGWNNASSVSYRFGDGTNGYGTGGGYGGIQELSGGGGAGHTNIGSSATGGGGAGGLSYGESTIPLSTWSYLYGSGGGGGTYAAVKPEASAHAGSGGGSGGTIYLKTNNGSIGTDKITANFGTGGVYSGANGGNGSVGRIHIEGSYTGTTSIPSVA